MTRVGEVNAYNVSKEFEWRIKDFFSLPVDGTRCFSPLFTFAGESWFFQILPNGLTENDSIGHAGLYICRAEPGFPIHLSVSLSFKTLDGKRELEGEFIHEYEKNEGHGYSKFIARSILLERRAQLVPSDTLTVVCTVKHYSEPLENTASFAAQDVLNDFKQLFLKKEDCDVVIQVQGKEFKAHRIILRARSPVLAATFRSNMKERATGIIKIEDCDPSSFSDFLCFLYCGELENLSTENVFELFYTADKYDVKDLRAKCMDFLENNLCIDTFCLTMYLAMQHPESKLMESATDFFIKNAPNIILTQQWQLFLAENPKEGNELLVKLLVPKPGP